MRLPLFVLPVALVLAAFACSDYSADDPAPAPSDAGADTAPPSPDAGIEAGPAPTGFCATKGDAAVWCQDFDSITDVTSLVPSSSVANADLSSQTFVSAPRSLRFTMPEMLSPPQYSVVATAIASEKDLRLDFDWRWARSTPLDGQSLQSVTIRKDVGQAFIGRACGVADAGVIPCIWYISVTPDAGAPVSDVKFQIPPPAALTKWSHIAFQVSFASLGHVLYEEDGVTLVNEDTATLKAPSTAPTSATIGVGFLQGSTSVQEMYFDNVAIELR